MNERMKLIRSGRKTLALEIRPGGEILIRAPRALPVRDIQDFIRKKENWILQNLQRIREAETLNPREEPLSFAELEALKKAAAADFRARAAHFAPAIGVSFSRITIRRQKSRWGSCSGRGALSFNLLLMLAPPEVRDYVAVHELCHLREMNHSPRFWAEVSAVLPSYREQRSWLKRNGDALMRKGGH